MRFDPTICPQCGEGPYRILATVETVTQLDQLADGTFEFGQSAVSWETQTPLVTDGEATLYCRNHHGYRTELVPEDEPPESSAGTTSDAELDLPFKYGLFVLPGSADGYYGIDGESNVTIASIDMDGNMREGEAEQYAEFITRACNAHGDMLQALRKLEIALELCPHWKPEMPPVLLGIIRAGIAKGGAS